MEEQIKLLSEMGFTRLEANIYLILVQNPRITGYKIAKALNEPVSNTYKSIYSLQNKGAVILDETGKSKKYSAVPIEAYFDQMERNFTEKRKKIEESLKNIELPPPDGGVYQLENVSQIYEKADQMIRNAKTSVFINISPGIMKNFKKSLESAAKASVNVLVRPYQKTEIPGCDISYSATINPPGKSLPFEILYLVTDGEEYITAFLDLNEKKVFKAIWSKNIHLTIIAYYGNLFEFLFVKLYNMLQSDLEKQEILSSLEKYFKFQITDITGFNEYFNTFLNKHK